MNVLTGQYSQLYTHKFKVSYTDWQPSSLQRKGITILQLPAGQQVSHVMIKPITPAAGGTLTSANLRIMQSPILSTGNSTSNQFAAQNALSVASESSGVFQSIVSKTQNTTSPGYTTVCNATTPTTILAVIDLIGGGLINHLTQGSWYVYITVLRIV